MTAQQWEAFGAEIREQYGYLYTDEETEDYE